MQRVADTAGVRLRPHVKTHKSIALGRLQLAAGATGITAGTVGEVEVFAAAGFDDIFLAYPVWAGGTHGSRLRAIHDSIRLTVGLDSRRAAEALADAMTGSERPLQVVIEVDCGAARSGIPPDEAGALAVEAARLGLDPVGAYTYGGHGDRNPEARETAARDEIDALEIALRSMRKAGFEPTVASAGTTPTAAFVGRPPVTEIRPGEYIFNDIGKLRIGACGPADLALFVASTVVSDAVSGQVIIDAGTKALGREGSEARGYGVAAGLPGSFLRKLNEYHGFLAMDPGCPRPAVGDPVAIAPKSRLSGRELVRRADRPRSRPDRRSMAGRSPRPPRVTPT